MRHPLPLSKRRSRTVVISALLTCVLTQVLVACLPGFPWRSQTVPEEAVRTDRFHRDGGWMRVIPTLEESIVQWQVFHLQTAVEPQDIVLVGDSSCLMGLKPHQITDLTHLKTWNLGTVGSLSTQGHAEVLELYLKKHPQAKPKLVVCYLARPTLLRQQHEIDELGVLNRFQEWLHGDDVGLFMRGPLAQLPGFRLRLPLYRAANQFLAMQVPVIGLDTVRGKLPSDTEVGRSLLESRGYLVEPRANQLPAEDPQGNSAHLSEDSLRGIKRMFELTDAQSIDLLFMMPPIPERYRDPRKVIAFERLAEQLNAAARPFPKVRIHSPLLNYVDDQFFATPHHMTFDGASRNSEAFVKLPNLLEHATLLSAQK